MALWLLLLIFQVGSMLLSAPVVVGISLPIQWLGKISLPASLAIGQALVITFIITLGVLFPNMFAGQGDEFWPFFFVPGIFIHAIIECTVIASLNDYLFAHLPSQDANTLLLTVIPGIVGIVPSGCLWYALGWLWIVSRRQHAGG